MTHNIVSYCRVQTLSPSMLHIIRENSHCIIFNILIGSAYWGAGFGGSYFFVCVLGFFETNFLSVAQAGITILSSWLGLLTTEIVRIY